MENKMSQKDAEKSDDNQRRPLIKKLHNFILNLIAFSANEKTEAVVKFTSLCSIPLIIGNYIPVEIAFILWLALLILNWNRHNESQVVSSILRKCNGDYYYYAGRDEVYKDGIAASLFLTIAFCISFLWNFTFPEIIRFLCFIPLCIYFGLAILFTIISFSTIVSVGSKLEEIYLKNIYKHITFKLLSHPNNREGRFIKSCIEEKLNIHDSDNLGGTLVMPPAYNQQKNTYIVLSMLSIIGMLFFIFLPDKHKETNRRIAKEITPQEVNAEYCKNFIDSIYDSIPGLPLTIQTLKKGKHNLREGSVLECTNEMNNNYKNGLPNYATHTPQEMQSYEEMKTKRRTTETRVRLKDRLDEIDKSCGTQILMIYTALYTMKSKGESKGNQVKRLRSIPKEEKKSIFDLILVDLSHKMLDEMYSKSGSTTDDEVAEQVFVFHEKCKEEYEGAMLLR